MSRLEMPTFRDAWLLLIFTACGVPSATTPTQTPPQLDSRPPPTFEADAARVPHFTIVSTLWVRSYVRAPDADVDVWAADPVNAKTIVPGIRHILIKLATDASPTDVALATTRANAAIARVKRGEDFANVADQVSEDSGTQRNGGVLPMSMLSVFVPAFRDAVKALAPGEVTKQPVRTEFGLHIIKREALDAETKRAAYRTARAPDVARKLAEEIAQRLSRSDGSSDVISDAIRALLEEQAIAVDSRPQLTGFANTADPSIKEDPACTRARQAALANQSAPAVVPFDGGEGFVVVTMMSASFRAPTSPALCGIKNVNSEQIEKLLERLKAQRAQQ